MKSTVELLEDFTKIMYEMDPMGLRSPNPQEYEAEALSILSRFCETAARFIEKDGREFDDRAAQFVDHVFFLWFNEHLIDPVPLTDRLVSCYRMNRKDSFDPAQVGQVTDPEV